MQFVGFELVLDAWEKSHFGAVTFDKSVVGLFMFKKLSELKSGKECDGLHSNWADFRRDDRCVIGFLSKAL